MKGARSIVAALGALACAACASLAPERGPAPEPATFPSEPPAPGIDASDGADWVQLASGEWLKGTIALLDRDTLELDSAQLGTLKLAWDEVALVRTTRPFTVLLDDRSELFGALALASKRLVVGDAGQARAVPASRVFRIVPGEPDEASFWSGRAALGATGRSGNTDQLDLSASFALKRRTARSRFGLDYAGAYGSVEGVQSANQHRLGTQLDLFVHPRAFVTPLGVEAFRDPFQNVALRLTPFTGVGYALVQQSGLEWDARLALGWRFTRFDSVEAGEPASEDTATLQPSSTLTADLTEKAQLELGYGAQLSLADASDTNQNASVALLVDLLWELDLDLRLRWNHVGEPRPDENGDVPQRDDFSLSLGLGWSF